MAGGVVLNILIATPSIKKELESLNKANQLPHVKTIKSAHPAKDIKKGTQSLTSGTLYIYPSGSRINDVAGRGKVMNMETGNAITFCVGMKRPDDLKALQEVGETIFSLVSSLSDSKLEAESNGVTKTTLTNLKIDNETRELYQDGFYFYSIRVLTSIKIQKLGE